MISIRNRAVELNWANYLQKHNPKLKANNKSDFWTATIRTQKIKMWQPLFHHLQQKKQHIELSYLSIWPSNNRWWHFQNCWFWVNKLTGLEKLLQFRKIQWTQIIFMNIEPTWMCSSIGDRTWTPYFWLGMNAHRHQT